MPNLEWNEYTFHLCGYKDSMRIPSENHTLHLTNEEFNGVKKIFDIIKESRFTTISGMGVYSGGNVITPY